MVIDTRSVGFSIGLAVVISGVLSFLLLASLAFMYGFATFLPIFPLGLLGAVIALFLLNRRMFALVVGLGVLVGLFIAADVQMGLVAMVPYSLFSMVLAALLFKNRPSRVRTP